MDKKEMTNKDRYGEYIKNRMENVPPAYTINALVEIELAWNTQESHYASLRSSLSTAEARVEELQQVNENLRGIIANKMNVLADYEQKIKLEMFSVNAINKELKHNLEISERDAGLYHATLSESARLLACDESMVDNGVKSLLKDLFFANDKNKELEKVAQEMAEALGNIRQYLNDTDELGEEYLTLPAQRHYGKANTALSSYNSIKKENSEGKKIKDYIDKPHDHTFD